MNITKNIKKTLVLALVAATTFFGLTTEAQAATQTLKTGYGSMLSLKVNGRYVNPTLVSAKSNVSGVVTVTKYRSLSSGIYFAKVTAKKAGTATIVVRYKNKNYTYNFTVTAPVVKPVPPKPSFTLLSKTSYRIYCSKVANATAYRLRISRGSANWSGASVSSATTNPSWKVNGFTKGVRYYYWIDVKGADGKWYGNSGRWYSVMVK